MSEISESKKTVRFSPLRPEDFDTYIQGRLEHFAQSLVDAEQLPLRAARRKAARHIGALLPEGIHTNGHYFFRVETAHDHSPVGTLWYQLKTDEASAFLMYIDVEPGSQTEGWGYAMMELLELNLRSLGIQRLRLNVFAHNAPALALYRRRGFDVISFGMSKRLAGD